MNNLNLPYPKKLGTDRFFCLLHCMTCVFLSSQSEQWLHQSCNTIVRPIGLYRDVWIAAIASSRKSPATQTAAICVRFQGRRVRHVYVTMHVTFLTRISALIYRRGLRQRVASLTLDCNGVFAIRALYREIAFAIQKESGDSNGGNV